MVQNKNEFLTFNTGINVTLGEYPTDYRDIVELKADLTSLKVPHGFITSVLHDGASASSPAAVYYLKGADASDIANWQKIATDVDVSLLTAGISLIGSYSTKSAGVADNANPQNGQYFFDKETNKFWVYSTVNDTNDWIEFFTIAALGIAVDQVDSLSFDASFNGIKLPTKDSDTKNISDVIDAYGDTVDLPEYITVSSKTSVKVRFTTNSDEYSELTLPAAVGQLEQYANAVRVVGKSDDVIVYENITEWKNGEIITLVYNAAINKWVAETPVDISTEFAFAKSFKDVDFNDAFETNNFAEDITDDIFNELNGLVGKKTFNFLTCDGNKCKFDIAKEGDGVLILSFIAGKFYCEIKIVRNGEEGAYTYVTYANRFNTVADATIENDNWMNDSNVSDDVRPVAAKALYKNFDKINVSLTWHNLNSNN